MRIGVGLMPKTTPRRYASSLSLLFRFAQPADSKGDAPLRWILLRGVLCDDALCNMVIGNSDEDEGGYFVRCSSSDSLETLFRGYGMSCIRVAGTNRMFCRRCDALDVARVLRLVEMMRMLFSARAAIKGGVHVVIRMSGGDWW